MKLTVLASGSTGNGYLLSGSKETLIIEAGSRLAVVKQALDFDMSRVVGCLISHRHGDHSKYLEKYMGSGITVLTSYDVIEAHHIAFNHFGIRIISDGHGYKLGEFKIIAFDVQHDVPCLGFLIDHPESGKVLFLTDSFMSEYTFKGLNHIIMEANYADDILEENILRGSVHPSMRPRLMTTHMELKTCLETLKANDLTGVVNIVLCHLSDTNSDSRKFIKDVIETTGKQVFVAEKNLIVDLNNEPY